MWFDFLIKHREAYVHEAKNEINFDKFISSLNDNQINNKDNKEKKRK